MQIPGTAPACHPADGSHYSRCPPRDAKPDGQRMAATFEFAPGSDKIICERPNFDQGAVLRALGIS